MKKVILLLSGLFLFPCLQAQDTTNLVKLQKALVENGVYQAPKNYKYQATKLNAVGDTLSIELINMRIPEDLNTEKFEDGKVYYVWEHTAWKTYEPILSPISNEIVPRNWLDADTTTMHLNEENLSLHPLRENQYYQAEVAAHPNVEFKDLVDNKFQNRVIILGSFGEYNKQEYKSIYSLKENAKYTLGKEELDCYKILAETEVKAFSFGSAKGKKSDLFKDLETINTTTFLVSENYGFVKIHYQFYDGEQLFLEMME